MNTRRGFLALLGVAASQMILKDPEFALWVPGKKLISIPKPPAVLVQKFEIGDIITIAGRYAVDPRTRKAKKHLQRFVVTEMALDGHGFNVWPHIEARVTHKDLDRVSAIKLGAPPILWDMGYTQ